MARFSTGLPEWSRNLPIEDHEHAPVPPVEFDPQLSVEANVETARRHYFLQRYFSTPADVKICRRQHGVLVHHLRRTLLEISLGHFYEIQPSDVLIEDLTRHLPSLPTQASLALERVLLYARRISEDCCGEPSGVLKAALRHAQRSQAFADILKEIAWFTSVVYYHNCRNGEIPSTIALKGYPWDAKVGYREQFILEKTAHDDWQEVMEELTNWNRDHLCSAVDCGNNHEQGDPRYCLATQILGRRDEAKFGVGAGQANHRSLLWTFDKNILEHGPILGSGAFGCAQEVTWLREKYALKTFNERGLSSLPAEASTLARLNHPHIVKVFAYSENSILMELMSTDLHKYMRRRLITQGASQPFPISAAIDLMLQVADAMSYLHSQNITHRDLKSGNILINPVDTQGLSEDGYVMAKIADFGLAKTKRDITRYSHMTHDTGTRRWMAPEIFGANKEDVHLPDAFPMKADVYSFGIVCFEILSGEEPFKDVKLTDLYKKLTASIPLRPQLPPSCPTLLASLICECWDGDPRKRPGFADVCRTLRYLKGLIIIGSDEEQLVRDVKWPFGVLTMVKKQGPWGMQDLEVEEYSTWLRLPPFRSSSPRRSKYRPVITPYSIGPTIDIRAVRLNFKDDIRSVRTSYKEDEIITLSGFQLSYVRDQNSWAETEVGARDARASTDWIRFDYPSEYLVQVEGSMASYESIKTENIFPDKYRAKIIQSLSLITNKKKYGPYGRFDQKNAFVTDSGRVVGFSGYSSDVGIYSLGVHVAPDITECIRSYLENG